MMSRSVIGSVVPLVICALGAAACAPDAPASDSAPTTDEGPIATAQSLSYGGFTISAGTPEVSTGSFGAYDDNVRGSFTLSGSGSVKAGTCLLFKWSDANNYNQVHFCTQESDCSFLDSSFTGGHGYCAHTDNNTGAGKICYVRPGPQTSYCAGSPAISGNPAIGAGTYYTPWVNAYPGNGASSDTYYFDYGTWTYQEQFGSDTLSYACFYGCSGLNGAPTTASQSPQIAATSFDTVSGSYVTYNSDP